MRIHSVVLAPIFLQLVCTSAFAAATHEESEKLLLPKDGPDKFPSVKLFSLYQNDSSPVDTLCPPTSQIEITMEKDSSIWTLHTLDIRGMRKAVGGDEFYVTFKDDSYASMSHPSAVAHVKDNNDGSYELYFVKTRYDSPPVPLMGTGNLTVWVEYTCNIGRIWPPGKNKWESNGSVERMYESHVLQQPMLHEPSPISFDIKLSDYDAVYAFGDSIMSQFLCYKLRMRRRNIFFEKNTGRPMLPETLTHFVSYFNSNLKPSRKNNQKIAILMNHGAWDLAKMNEGQHSFKHHLISLRRLVLYMKTKVPDVDLIWRSTAAEHVHRGPDIERLRYVSASRTKSLYEAQMEIMRELEVPVLDIYNYTYESGFYTKPNDALHYMDFVLGRILQEIYPTDYEMTSKFCKTLS